MNKTFFATVSILLILLCIPIHVNAELHINEIYPAPSMGNQEWVEIYNDGVLPVDLSGFTLKDASGNPLILPAQIPALGFVTATASSVLNNSGDTIHLRDKNNQLITSVTHPSINTNNVYMRCPDGIGTFIISTISTQGLSNQGACPTPTPLITPTLTPTNTPIVTITPSPTTAPLIEKIYISEVMIEPESGSQEWIELYNDNDFPVTLQNWYIDDAENTGSAPKQFTLFIEAKSLNIIMLSTGIFNNDKDEVRLLNHTKNLIDSFEYASSAQGYTWGRKQFTEDSFCLQNPSFGVANNNCYVAVSPTPTVSISSIISKIPTPTKTPTPTKSMVVKNTSSSDEFNEKIKTKKKVEDYEFITYNNVSDETPQMVSAQPATSVLGIMTNDQVEGNVMYGLRSLLIISVSYSALVIASLLLKLHSFSTLYK